MTHYSTETLEDKHQFNKNPQCEVLITQTPSDGRMRYVPFGTGIASLVLMGSEKKTEMLLNGMVELTL
jgi:hypothetical protein